MQLKVRMKNVDSNKYYKRDFFFIISTCGTRGFRMNTVALLRLRCSSGGVRGCIIIMWDVLKSKQNRTLPPFLCNGRQRKKNPIKIVRN